MTGSLPAPRLRGPLSLEETLAARRSVRAFSPQSLRLDEISQLAWAAQGVSDRQRGLRTAPSAGALFPLEVHLLTSEGVFHYLPAGHRLERLSFGDQRPRLARVALGQAAVRQAPLVMVISAVTARTRVKYGGRAERYVAIEAGHAAQDVLLQATALGLASVPIGAFDDDGLRGVLRLPAEQAPLCVIAVGRVAR
jgi:SagB-type dehydrogenase family enzyme